MNKNHFLIAFFLLFFLPALVHCQSAFIRFSCPNEKTAVKTLDQYSFVLNEVELKRDTSAHEIPIHPSGTDTLIVTDGNHPPEKILLKLMPNQQYLIRCNACCAYDLAPTFRPGLGAVRFECLNCAEDVALTGEEGTSFGTVSGDSTTDFMVFVRSAMKIYNPYFLVIKDGKKDIRIGYHFLHGDKITVRYDGGSGEYRLTTDSHLLPGEREHYERMQAGKWEPHPYQAGSYERQAAPEDLNVLKKGIEYTGDQLGQVIVKVLVDAEGNYIRHLILLETDAALTKAVEKNLKDAKFHPAIDYEGKAVMAWTVVAVVFPAVK